MNDNIENPIADENSRTESSDQAADPRGPVPALPPPDDGGRSPTRPSTSAVCEGELESPAVPARPLNAYEAKQQAKRERLQRASESAGREANALYGRARSMADVIPLGHYAEDLIMWRGHPVPVEGV